MEQAGACYDQKIRLVRPLVHNDVQANQLLVKAQCQVLMDLTSQTPGKNEPTNVLQWDDVTLFAESLQHYKKRYSHLEKHSEATRQTSAYLRAAPSDPSPTKTRNHKKSERPPGRRHGHTTAHRTHPTQAS